MFVVVAGGCGWCAGRCVERLQPLCRKVEASLRRVSRPTLRRSERVAGGR